jgi:hypothetical protein
MDLNQKQSSQPACILVLIAGLLLTGIASGPANGAIDERLDRSLELQGRDEAWGMSSSLGLLSSTMNRDEADYIARALFSVGLNKPLPHHFSLGLDLAGQKDLNREMKSRLTKAKVSVDRPFWSDMGFTTRGEVAYFLAVNKDEIKYDRYRGAIQLRPQVSYQFKQGNLAGLSLTLDLSMLRRFHKYSTSEGGYPLVGRRITTGFGLAYKLWQRMTLSARFANTQAWDHDGDAYRDQYSATQTIGYQWDRHLSLAVGHTTGGYTFDYNGADYDLKFYDRYTSKVFGSLAYSY